MSKKRKSFLPVDINWKKLKIEVTVLMSIALIVTAIQLGPWLMSQPVPQLKDPYANYKKLYEEVLAYDYGLGPNDKLADKIYEAINLPTNNTVFHYFQLKAAIEYYHQIHAYTVLRKRYLSR